MLMGLPLVTLSLALRRPLVARARRFVAVAGAEAERANWLLIDGTNLIYRSFYAMPVTLTRASDGQPIGAVLGVSNMLLRVAAPYVLAGARVVFVLDPVKKEGSWRTELDPEYKANRKPMPDDLRIQFADAVGAAEAFGATVVSVEGHEADDVIATVARIQAASGAVVDVWSGDKDLLQLVAYEGVRCLDAAGQFVDGAGVVAKFGVAADKLADYLALVGDASDNVRGVQGIGPKGAAQLIQAYGDLTQALAQAPTDDEGTVPKRARNALANADRDRLAMSRRLVELSTAVAGVPKDILEPHVSSSSSSSGTKDPSDLVQRLVVIILRMIEPSEGFSRIQRAVLISRAADWSRDETRRYETIQRTLALAAPEPAREQTYDRLLEHADEHGLKDFRSRVLTSSLWNSSPALGAILDQNKMHPPTTTPRRRTSKPRTLYVEPPPAPIVNNDDPDKANYCPF